MQAERAELLGESAALKGRLMVLEEQVQNMQVSQGGSRPVNCVAHIANIKRHIYRAGPHLCFYAFKRKSQYARACIESMTTSASLLSSFASALHTLDQASTSNNEQARHSALEDATRLRAELTAASAERNSLSAEAAQLKVELEHCRHVQGQLVVPNGLPVQLVLRGGVLKMVCNGRYLSSPACVIEYYPKGVPAMQRPPLCSQAGFLGYAAGG